MLPDHGGNTVPDFTHPNSQKIKKMISYSTVFINEEEEVFFSSRQDIGKVREMH